MKNISKAKNCTPSVGAVKIVVKDTSIDKDTGRIYRDNEDDAENPVSASIKWCLRYGIPSSDPKANGKERRRTDKSHPASKHHRKEGDATILKHLILC